jgi:hypothetical protein
MPLLKGLLAYSDQVIQYGLGLMEMDRLNVPTAPLAMDLQRVIYERRMDPAIFCWDKK